MTCSDIIDLIGILVSAGMGIWIATAITKGHTQERFLKDYFTEELNLIKKECKDFFDEICFDKMSAQNIKTGFKILSMRITAFELNLGKAFKNAHSSLSTTIQSIQLDITNSDSFNDQFKKHTVTFPSSEKQTIFESRSKLLTEFSNAVIVINKATVNKR